MLSTTYTLWKNQFTLTQAQIYTLSQGHSPKAKFYSLVKVLQVDIQVLVRFVFKVRAFRLSRMLRDFLTSWLSCINGWVLIKNIHVGALKCRSITNIDLIFLL